MKIKYCLQFSSVQLLSCVRLLATPWITAHQASLSITNSQSSLKLMSIELVMPSSHLILCRPLLLLPPILPTIRVFSNESTLHMQWPKYWSFSFSLSPSNEHPGLTAFSTGNFQAKDQGLRKLPRKVFSAGANLQNLCGLKVQVTLPCWRTDETDGFSSYECHYMHFSLGVLQETKESVVLLILQAASFPLLQRISC